MIRYTQEMKAALRFDSVGPGQCGAGQPQPAAIAAPEHSGLELRLASSPARSAETPACERHILPRCRQKATKKSGPLTIRQEKHNICLVFFSGILVKGSGRR